jgi:hypothetical protein
MAKTANGSQTGPSAPPHREGLAMNNNLHRTPDRLLPGQIALPDQTGLS